MPRPRQVPRADAHPTALTLYEMLFGDRDPVAEPGTATGSPGNFKAGRDVVPTEEQIAAVPGWSVATCYSPVERAVLAYADCLVLDGGRTPDSVFSALRRHLSDEEILELTYIT